MRMKLCLEFDCMAPFLSLRNVTISALFVSPDPQLDLRREELHHHLPPPHRHALPVHEQRGREGGEDRLKIGIGIVRELEFSPKMAPKKRGFLP